MVITHVLYAYTYLIVATFIIIFWWPSMLKNRQLGDPGNPVCTRYHISLMFCDCIWSGKSLFSGRIWTGNLFFHCVSFKLYSYLLVGLGLYSRLYHTRTHIIESLYKNNNNYYYYYSQVLSAIIFLLIIIHANHTCGEGFPLMSAFILNWFC